MRGAVTPLEPNLCAALPAGLLGGTLTSIRDSPEKSVRTEAFKLL